MVSLTFPKKVPNVSADIWLLNEWRDSSVLQAADGQSATGLAKNLAFIVFWSKQADNHHWWGRGSANHKWENGARGALNARDSYILSPPHNHSPISQM